MPEKCFFCGKPAIPSISHCKECEEALLSDYCTARDCIHHGKHPECPAMSVSRQMDMDPGNDLSAWCKEYKVK